MRLDKLQENNFINKITGKGEHPIRQMPGLRPPNDDEHQMILKRVKKKLNKEIAASALMTIISIAFIIFYIYMYIHTKSKYILLAAGVFAVIVCINVYKFICIDAVTDKTIKDRVYRVRKVRIHHFMPGFGGKPEAKIQDTDGNVYSYEFIVNRKTKKAYNKNNEIEFFLIELNKEKERYCLMICQIEDGEEHAEKISEKISK